MRQKDRVEDAKVDCVEEVGLKDPLTSSRSIYILLSFLISEASSKMNKKNRKNLEEGERLIVEVE